METIEMLKNKTNRGSVGAGDGEDDWAESDGWDVEDAGLEGDEVDLEASQEVAKLRVTARRAASSLKRVEDELCTMTDDKNNLQAQLDERESECEVLRSARDETVKELVETNRRLEVLEQFFNKKEAELQKQLGLQSARFGDVTIDADTTAKKLISVTAELDSTNGAMKVLKGELEEQEKSLKAAVALQEKKAHENWVAARQAERKLNDLQTEVGTLRNRLTVAESRAQSLEQEKSDLQATITTMHAQKPESVSNGLNGLEGGGSDTASSVGVADPASLPPLPGLPASGPSSLPSLLPALPLPSLPGMMVPPMFGGAGGLPGALPGGLAGGLPGLLDTRPPPVGRMSPPTRDRDRSDLSFRSSSPPRGGRDYSPSSRSERRGGGRRHSPRRGPSPTRSDRGYYRDSDTDRSY